MKSPTAPPPAAPPANRPSTYQVGLALVFFALCFLYVWLWLQPAAEYSSQGVVFLLSGSFLHQFAVYPGGLADYAAAYLAQLNLWNWLGALVFTGLAGGVALVTRGWCRHLAGTAPAWLCLAPAWYLVAWRGQYDGQALAASVPWLLALSMALSYVPMSRLPVWQRWPAGWLLGGALYYLAGLWAFLLFLFLTGWVEVRQSRSWLRLFAWLALAALLIPGGWQALELPPPHLNHWETLQAKWLAAALFLLVPASLLYLVRPPRNAFTEAAAPTAVAPPAAKARKPGKPKPQAPAPASWRREWRKPVFALGLLLAGGGLLWSLFNGSQRKLAQIEYDSARGNDQGVLAAAAQLDHLPPEVELRLHLALYHTGRLTQDLFAFAEGGGQELLPGLTLGPETIRAQIPTLWELGQVNDAEHLAHEVLENDGERPEVLRLLALVNVLKNRPEAARVFLNNLSRVPFQGAWAKARLAELDANPRLTGNAELEAARAHLPTTDYPHGAIATATEAMLHQLLASHPNNQMAYEYLLTYYLLSGDFTKLAREAEKLEGFKFAVVPRHIQEALLLGQQVAGVSFELHDLKLQPEIVQRYQAFREAIRTKPGQPPVTYGALRKEFGDTYWLYYTAYLRHKDPASE